MPQWTKSIKSIHGLYVIIDPQMCNGRNPLEIAEAALRGGANVLQLRDKVSDDGDLINMSKDMLGLCEQHKACFIVNDRIGLTSISRNCGLHLGQHDLPISHARDLVGNEKIIGRSNALLEEAIESERQGADYVAVGTIFPTESKSNTRYAGISVLKEVKEAVSVPVVAIGGIDSTNAKHVIQSGADAVAVLGFVCSAEDPTEKARLLRNILDSAFLERGNSYAKQEA